MDLRWFDPERPDGADVAAAVALMEAGRVVDHPHDLPVTTSSFIQRLRHGWDGDPSMWALARDDDGASVGLLEVNLPHWDNTHLGFVDVTVDPRSRREGVGRRLFDIGVERVRAEGRALLLAECYDDTAGAEFLEAQKLEPASQELQRRLDVSTTDWATLDPEYALAGERAEAYELVRVAGTTPEHLLAEIVQMTGAINDAPTDELDIEDEIFSPDRIRAFEAAQLAYDRRLYRLLVRDRETGALAGHTMVGVERERPWFAHQYDTSVLRAHRGHRLGLLLKIGMLRWLRDAEPQLLTVDTWNAASNSHMIRVNEIVGYQVVASAVVWQRHL